MEWVHQRVEGTSPPPQLPLPTRCPREQGALGPEGRAPMSLTPGDLRPSALQRPTAKELLKHKFLARYTKKTSFLTELIDRYKRWKSEGHGEESSSEDSDM